MKKATVKPAKSNDAAKTPPKKKTVKKVAKVASVSAPRGTKPAAPKVAAPKASAIKPTAAKLPATIITAAVDVGFGNTLYLRGEGPGLSWDIGVPMVCVADDKWSIELPGSGSPVTFKVLVNDTTWSTGPDYMVGSGEDLTIAPTFH